MSTPKNMAVYLMAPEGAFEVKEAPYSKPLPGEVVIKNAAVAINPMDWKIQAFGKRIQFPLAYPGIIGNDLAGEIYEVGEGVTGFKIGDRVISKPSWFLTRRPEDAAFQLYTHCAANLTSLLPPNISFTSGCVLPLAITTSAMGLYPSHRLGLPLPQATPPKPINKVILVWGGSSSCGSAAIQLAVASGLTVVATASSRNHELVKSIGAKDVLDYANEGVVGKLVEVIKGTGMEFTGAVDAIAEDKTWRACAEVVKALGGGKVATFLPRGIENVPEGVEMCPVNDTSSIGQHKEIVEGVWGTYVPEALKAGTLKTIPQAIVAGKGLEKIIDGIKLLSKGVSAGKVVVEI